MGKNFLFCLQDIPENTRLYIYGSGVAGHRFLKLIKKYRKDIEFVNFLTTGITDTSISINNIDSEPIQNSIIVIASTFFKEIEEELVDRKIDNYLIIPQRFLEIKTDEKLSSCEFPLSSQILDQHFCHRLWPILYSQQNLQEVRSSFADEKS